MDRFAAITGRRYNLFDYTGHPEAERVIVMMGSGAETAEETVDWLIERGEKVGILKVRLFHPFSIPAFLAVLPPTVRSLAVLDRTKEPGAVGDPLYLEVLAALREARDEGFHAPDPRGIAGRYGLSSKEFNPAMVKAVFDELSKDKPKNHFTVGIVDDVTWSSLAVDPDFDIEPDDVTRALFYGLGSDSTVGANKNSIKIIGEETDHYAQGYFVYDSKKAGAVTISHLRFGPRPIRSAYLIRRAGFVACHQFDFLDRFDMLEAASPGAVFLLNAPLRSGGGLGPSAARGPGADPRKEPPLPRDRRLPRGPRGGDGRPHQHDHADLLLRPLRRPPPRGGDRRDQAQTSSASRPRSCCSASTARWERISPPASWRTATM